MDVVAQGKEGLGSTTCVSRGLEKFDGTNEEKKR